MNTKNFNDTESASSLERLRLIQEMEKTRFKDVKTCLVVLSAAAMIFDRDALRSKILWAYPDAAIFFYTTSGKPLGVEAPQKVDLLIDFTGPRQRQGLFFARKMRKKAKYAVGRNAGLFRKKVYDRVFDEKAKNLDLPIGVIDRERLVQKEVLALAGIPSLPVAGVTPDHGKNIALALPPLSRS